MRQGAEACRAPEGQAGLALTTHGVGPDIANRAATIWVSIALIRKLIVELGGAGQDGGPRG